MTFAAAAALPLEQPPDDVRTLVEAAQRRDAGSFSELYSRFGRAVHGVMLARVPRADVEDLVQDVVLTAWRRLGELREPAAFGGWLVAIARRRAIDYLRKTPALEQLPDTLSTIDAD